MFATNPHTYAQRIEANYGDKLPQLTTRVIDATDPYPSNRAKYASPAFPHYAQPLVKVEWATTNAKTAPVRRFVITPTWGWTETCKTLDAKVAVHAKAPTTLVFGPEVASILRHYAKTESLADIAAAIRKAGNHDKKLVAYQDQTYADRFAGDSCLFAHSASVGPLALRMDRGVDSMRDAQAAIHRKIDDVPAMTFAFRKGVVNLTLWDQRMRWDTAVHTVYLFGDLPETVIDAAASMIGKPLAQFVDAPFAAGLKVSDVRTDEYGSCGAPIRLIYHKTDASSVKEKA